MRQQLWDAYYSAIVGWSLHPRNLEKETRTIRKICEDAAEITEIMIEVRNEKCRGL